MSKYCGKFDIADAFGEATDDAIKNTKFYINGNRLDISNRFELIPYYPYIAHVITNNRVHMSEQSYVDRREKERLEYLLYKALVIYRRCKRKKTDFNTDANKREVHLLDIEEEIPDYIEEIFQRIEEYKENAAVDGIHIETGVIPMFRKCLVDEMIKNGYSEKDANNWVYKHCRTFE